jgi:hypothetical protein
VGHQQLAGGTRGRGFGVVVMVVVVVAGFMVEALPLKCLEINWTDVTWGCQVVAIHQA